MSLSHGNAPRPSGGARMARTAGMLALFTLLSRLLGLVRDMGMAWMVGCGPVADALVAALRETSVIFGMLLAVIFLHERLSRSRIMAILIVMGGAMLIRLG